MSAAPSPKQIELTEHSPQFMAADALPYEIGRELWETYGENQGGQVRVEFPTPRTDNRWRLTAPGWVGHIPLSQGYSLTITPKVHLPNLMRMWEYAYQLRGFHFIEGLYGVQSLQGFYEGLAEILANRVLRRVHKGVYHAYVPHLGQLPYVRGRMCLTNQWRTPAQIRVDCQYEAFTADIPDNQILQFTLQQVAGSQLCRQRVQQQVRRAYLALHGLVASRNFRPADCLGRSYGRHNQEYQALHAICRFLLEYSGPLHQVGTHPMMPFLVDMARLYELFVAEWLKAHLPPAYHLKSQERVDIDQDGNYHFNIDLVLYHQSSNMPAAVLDTKYRTPHKAAADEIAQVMAYAQARRSPRAILVYPTALAAPLDARVGQHTQVRSLLFPLDGDLEKAGQQFLKALLSDELAENWQPVC